MGTDVSLTFVYPLCSLLCLYCFYFLSLFSCAYVCYVFAIKRQYVCRRTFFSNRCSSYSFCPTLTKVGTLDLRASTRKNRGTDFRNFALEISWRISKILRQQRSSLGRWGLLRESSWTRPLITQLWCETMHDYNSWVYTCCLLRHRIYWLFVQTVSAIWPARPVQSVKLLVVSASVNRTSLAVVVISVLQDRLASAPPDVHVCTTVYWHLLNKFNNK